MLIRRLCAPLHRHVCGCGAAAPDPIRPSRVLSRPLSKKKEEKKKVPHIPVMKEEVLGLWLPATLADADADDPICLVDGTVGFGGHTLAAASAARAAGRRVRVLGIDRDASVRTSFETAAAAASQAGAGRRLVFHHGSFADVSPALLARHAFPPRVHGILLDCGVNSHQLDVARRGFSYRRDGPLDMRFDAPTAARDDREPQRSTATTTAQDIVNGRSAAALAALFRTHADEPRAEEIAAAIVECRSALRDRHGQKKGAPGMRTALELRCAVEEALERARAAEGRPPSRKEIAGRDAFRNLCLRRRPPGQKRPRPKDVPRARKLYENARTPHADALARVFQALRIATNDELGHLRSVFRRGEGGAARCLAPGGRLVVLAFQPGEDAIVREGMAALVATGDFRHATPSPEGEEDGDRARRPTREEVKANGRARTARLRAVERVR